MSVDASSAVTIASPYLSLEVWGSFVEAWTSGFEMERSLSQDWAAFIPGLNIAADLRFFVASFCFPLVRLPLTRRARVMHVSGSLVSRWGLLSVAVPACALRCGLFVPVEARSFS